MLEVTLIRFTWRFLLMCFLLVALSFQGIAQASMITCEQGHPGHGFLIESAHEGAHASADHADHQHHAKAEKAKTFKDKCNRCAPCCLGTAIPTESALVIAAPVSAQDFPALTAVNHSTDRGRLARPPRAFLA